MAKVILTSTDTSYTVAAGNTVDLVGLDGVQAINIQDGASVNMEGSFAGDTINLVGNAANYTMSSNGATVTLTHITTGATIVLGAKLDATVLQFEDGQRDLKVDTTSGAAEVKLGDDTVTATESTPTNSTPTTGGGSNLAVAASVDTIDEGGEVTFNITGADANTTYAYQLGGIQAGDVASNSLLDTITTDADGNASVTVVTTEDRTTETEETLSFSLVGQTVSADVTVNDTSLDNVAPVVDATQDVTTDEDNAATITVAATDDTAGLQYTFSAPANGTVTDGAVAGEFIYTPNADYNGADSFVVTVTDADGATSQQTVNVTVNAVNDGPVANATTLANGTEDTAYVINAADITANATDAEGDSITLTAIALADAAQGTIVDNGDGTYTLTPAQDVNGTINLNVTMTDGNATADSTVTFELDAVNDAPVATNPAEQAGAQGQAFSFDASTAFSDVDDASLTYSSATLPAGLSIDTATGVISGTPGTAGVGVTSVTVTATDAAGLTADATFDINIANVDPVAADDTIDNVLSGQKTPIDVLANDTDGDDKGLTVTAVTQPAQGGLVEISADGKTVEFTSTPGFSGAVEFTYTVTDSNGGTATATATANVITQLGGTTGPDNLIGSSDAETLEGGAGNDTINGGSGADVIDAGADDDTVTFYGAENNIAGGAGVDTLKIAATNSQLFGIDLGASQNQAYKFEDSDGDGILHESNDLASTSVSGFENLDASDSAIDLVVDHLVDDGVAAAPALAAGFGDQAATTSIKTGSGNDEIDVGNHTAVITIESGAGNDTVTANSTTVGANIDGGEGNDTLTAAGADDTLTGGEGNDQITAGAGNDVVDAGAGDDSVNAGDGDDVVTTGAGEDDITLGTGNQSVDAGADNDQITVAIAQLTTDDTLNGGDGEDSLVVTGGTAVGDAVYAALSSIETITTNAEVLETTLGATANAADFTTLAGNDSKADVITIGADFTRALTVDLAGGNDSVDGSASTADLTVADVAGNLTANDTLKGGSDDGDVIQLTADGNTAVLGADVTGFETISVVADGDNTIGITTDDAQLAADGDVLTIDAAALTGGTATLNATSGETNKTDVTLNVTGGEGNDSMAGGTEMSNFNGADGNDAFYFASANLTENDSITGGEGDDTLVINNASTVVDADFTNVTSVETFTQLTSTHAIGLTLDTLANASGLATVTGNGAAADAVTVNAGFTNALTVNIATGDDDVDASASTADITIAAAAASITINDSLVGGSDDGDVIKLMADNGTAQFGASVSGFETIEVDANPTTAAHNITIVTDDGMVVNDTGSLTVNASNLTDENAKLIFTSNEDSTATINVTGGAGKDELTIGTEKSNFDGGANDDTFKVVASGGALTADDTLTGGEGDDTLMMLGTETLADAAFTNISSVETLTVDTGKALAVTLDSLANAAGLTTVSGDTAQNDAVTVAAGFTNALTINLGGGNDTVAAGSSGADITASAVAASFTADDKLEGGSGSNDVIEVIADDNGTGAVFGTNVSGFETINVKAGATASHNVKVTTSNEMVVDNTGSLTVDAAALTDSGAVLTFVSLENSTATINVTGGAGNDVLTAGVEKSNYNGGAGNDTFNFAVASLTSDDTVDGGEGDNKLVMSTATPGTGENIADAQFTNVTNVQTIELAASTAADGVTYTFGAEASEAGITTITGGADAKSVTVDAAGMTTGVTIDLTADVASAAYTVAGSSQNDTIILGDTSTENGFVQGGAGADTITLSAAAAAIDTVRVNLASDLATGTTLANADKVTGFGTEATNDDDAPEAGEDIIEFVGATLQSGGGGLNPLSTTSDNFTQASDVLVDATTANLASFATGAVSSAYILTVAEASLNVSGSLMTDQSSIDEAVTYLTGNGIAATAVANTNVILGVSDGTNMAFFQYQEGTADAGIQANELTLVGVYDIDHGTAALAYDNFA